MCLAVPGRIIKIENDQAIVDYGSEQRSGIILEDDSEYKEGDYTIIQGGFLVAKIEEEEALRALSLYNEIIKK